MNKRNKSDKRFWLGLILVFIGAAWLLDNLNIVPGIPHYFMSWPTILILIGVYLILGKGKMEPGLIMVGIGSVFLLDRMNLLEIEDIWPVFWPVIIIVVGISLIMRRNWRHQGRDHYNHLPDDEKKNDIDFVDDFALFGGREIAVDSQQFRGGKITTMFGGISLDLRNADLTEGVTKIDVFAMFGGSSIIVPPDWSIKVEVFSLFGGFEDNRYSSVKVMPNASKTLVVTGFVMFGGGDIKLTK